MSVLPCLSAGAGWAGYKIHHKTARSHRDIRKLTKVRVTSFLEWAAVSSPSGRLATGPLARQSPNNATAWAYYQVVGPEEMSITPDNPRPSPPAVAVISCDIRSATARAWPIGETIAVTSSSRTARKKASSWYA